MNIHDPSLATSGCVVDRNNRCVVESHYRDATLPERVKIDIDNLRKGAATTQVIVMHPESATRIADELQEMLDDNIALEKKVNDLDKPASEPRAKCDVPPAGWSCSREPGHSGPCAARPTTYVSQEEADAYRRETRGTWDVYQCDFQMLDHWGNLMRCDLEKGHEGTHLKRKVQA